MILDIINIVKKNGDALQYIDLEYRKDKKIILIAVKQNGYALRHVDPEFRNDKEIVL